MKYKLNIMVMALAAITIINCSKSTNSSVDQDEAELNIIETELNAVVLENPTDTGDVTKRERFKKRFKAGIKRINRLLTRLNKYLENNPNDDVQALVDTAQGQLDSSLESIEAGDFKAGFTSARDARKTLREAIKLVRASR